MGQGSKQLVLFLCTGNHDHCRCAETIFNSVADRMGLPWHASSRVINLKDHDYGGRVTPAADPDPAVLIIALMEEDEQNLLRERVPGHLDQLLFWPIKPGPEAPGAIEQQVMQLIARLFGGTRPPSAGEMAVQSQVCSKCQKSLERCTCNTTRSAVSNAVVVKVGRETKGRRGKGVTTVWGIPLDEEGMRELAARLKERCGTGGTVKDGRIEIQGDQRERVVTELERLGYKVKRVGG